MTCDRCFHGVGAHAVLGAMIGPGVYHLPEGGARTGPCTVAGCDCGDYFQEPQRLADAAERMAEKRAAKARALLALGIGADIDRNVAIKFIRENLRKRSGKAWSVTGGRGTAWGWIRIEAPPARRVCNHLSMDLQDGESFYQPHNDDCRNRRWYTSREDCAELAKLLGIDRVHFQGESIPSSSDHYLLYCARAAKGSAMGLSAERYWD